ncbi:hypothetical protein COU37_01905 [Candidatus Micrarchaeota archaeon CG10_big_fil_rev_8_21_14_0_10_45_29]|nr:MAG: hypothetical protein COU37_01905 [Candidatus Micrarchaeota archaeon CG10_big_fil_rev_8_21_14_0_10_45_29]
MSEHVTVAKGDEGASSALYAIALAVLVGCAVIASAVWFSAGGISGALSSLDQTIMAKNLVVGTGTAAAAAQNPTPTQQQPSAAQPSAAQPSAPNTVDVSGRDILGSADAQITMVEFSEFQCPYCTRAHPTVKQLLSDYDGKLNLVHMNFIVHPTATTSSVSVECAGDQDKYYEMHDKIFTTQITDADGLKGLAAEVGLDMATYNACMSAGKSAELAAQQSAASAIGVRGTPTFLIGKMQNGKVVGEILVGAQPIENFKALIDAQMG